MYHLPPDPTPGQRSIWATNLLWDALSRLAIHRLSCLQVDSVSPALLFLVPVLVFRQVGLLLLAFLLTVAVVEHFSSCAKVDVLSPEDVNQVNVLEAQIATIEQWSCAKTKSL